MNTCLPGMTSNKYESSGAPTSTSTSSSSAISRARQSGAVSPSSILPPGNSHSSRPLSISTTRPSGDCRTPLIETGNIENLLSQQNQKIAAFGSSYKVCVFHVGAAEGCDLGNFPITTYPGTVLIQCITLTRTSGSWLPPPSIT